MKIVDDVKLPSGAAKRRSVPMQRFARKPTKKTDVQPERLDAPSGSCEPEH